VARHRLLDIVTNQLRQSGVHVERGEYIDDILFDAIIREAEGAMTTIHTESFATTNKEWMRAEHDAGYFLYGVARTQSNPVCIIQPPATWSNDAAVASYERIGRMMTGAGVRSLEPPDVPLLARSFETQEQLPLLMA
jgi:hypothetical protein